MPRRNFKTVSDSLLEHAEEIATDFENRGYQIGVEKLELGFPYTPTLLCRRHRTTIIVEVDVQILSVRINAWVAYACSCGQDTRIAVCLPTQTNLTPEQENILREQGVGLYFTTGNGVIEKIAPNDLALGIQLPLLDSLPRKLRPLLGPAYEQFKRSQWREGFEDACQAFENEARRYLKAGCRSGRIIITTNKGPRNLTSREINRLTMGQLAVTFSQIQNQNHADSVIGQALKKINKDRVGVVHHKSKVGTEKRLRTNVGQHMWIIVAAMKELI